MTKTFEDLLDDTFDIRDVIARCEELQDIDGIEDLIENLIDDEEAKELVAIREFLDNVRGYGGDEEWCGDWFPSTFIADHHWQDYAQTLCEEIEEYKIPSYFEIDWEATACNVQQDYSSVEVYGTTYWFR